MRHAAPAVQRRSAHSDGPAWRTWSPAARQLPSQVVARLLAQARQRSSNPESRRRPPSASASRAEPAAAARPSCQPSLHSLRQVPAASRPAATAAAARLWHGAPPPPLQLGCCQRMRHFILETCYMPQGLAAVCCRTCRRRCSLACSLAAAAPSPVPTPWLQDGSATAVRGTQ